MAAASSENQLLITTEETKFAKSPSRSGSPITQHTQHTRSSSSSRSRSPMQSRRQARSRSPMQSRQARSRSPMRSRRQTRSRSLMPSRRQSRSRSPFRPQQRFRSRSPTRFQRRANYGTHSRDRRDRRRENPSPNRCLGIFGLSLHTKQGDLERIFSEYGIVEDVKIIHDRKTGNSKRFGFIYFKHIKDAIEARDRCSGMEIDQRNVRIDFSTTQRAHSPTPGIYKGNGSYREDRRRDDRRNFRHSSPR